MTQTEQIIQRGQKFLTPNYRQAPVVLVRGRGSRVWDAEGREYLDAIAGIATCSLGHCHPALVEVIEAQARELWHVSNLFFNPKAVELAEALAGTTSWARRVFLCNSGAESNEALLKLSRRYHADRGAPERHEIVTCHNSFHGRTLFALTATGQPKYHHGFEPLVPGVKHVPYGDVAALEAAVTEKTAVFLVEPIQGEAGVYPAPAGYLAAARELTRRKGALLGFDEVQTGMGRTGKLWAHEWEGVTPDLMSSAKALANGYPMGALLASEEVGSHLTPGTHASTFGGNALGAAVAVRAIQLIRALLPDVAARSAQLVARLGALKPGGRVVEVRGRGLLLGVVLQGVDAGAVVEAARARGLLVNSIGDRVVRLAPPLTLTAAEADEAADKLAAAIAAAPAL
ncbi:MAG TPA: aspartate aminotransferase family protein [Anaeromyxobacteraceae bacterium]|nr:aspartate aminotransferase family protein [Anaeromyxobacteraceae bacterium]